MHWGFYCRTCGVSSRSWFDDPVKAALAYLAIQPKIDALTRDEDVTLPTVQIPVIVFLSAHTGHDLWAECETGVFRLAAGRRPHEHVVPPKFASQSLGATASRPGARESGSDAPGSAGRGSPRAAAVPWA